MSAVEVLAQAASAGSSGSSGGTLFVAIFGGLALLSWARGRVSGAGGQGHVHGSTRRKVAVHEAGHVVATEGVGGKVRSARVDTGWFGGVSGEVRWRMPTNQTDAELAEAHLVALYGGQLAAGRDAGCWADDEEIARIRRDVPEADARRARRRAEKLVDRARRRGRLDELAARLDARGRL